MNIIKTYEAHRASMTRAQRLLVEARNALDARMEAWERLRDKMVLAGTWDQYCEETGINANGTVYDAVC